jgi:hypothetical protein
VWSADGALLDHGEPDGVTIPEITQHVYSAQPTTAQTRTVQRTTARLAGFPVFFHYHSSLQSRAAGVRSPTTTRSTKEMVSPNLL